MPEFTTPAAEHIVELLEKSGAQETQALRLYLTDSGWRTSIDQLRPGDIGYKRDGRFILVVDSKIVDRLRDTVLSIAEGPDGATLALTH